MLPPRRALPHKAIEVRSKSSEAVNLQVQLRESAPSQHGQQSSTSSMAITPLVLPSSSSAESPALVTVHPAAIATILDQHLRRPRSQDGSEQDRVLGTLMGSRNEVSIGICPSLACLHHPACFRWVKLSHTANLC